MNPNAPSTAFPRRQTPLRDAAGAVFGRLNDRVERWLEAERVQLPLWVPVALGSGILAWFALPARVDWMALICLCLGLAGLLLLIRPWGGRLAHVLGVAALLIAAGCLLPWAKSALVGGPFLARPAFVTMEVRVADVEALPARGLQRLAVLPQGRPDLPARVRLNLADGDAPDMAIRAGDRLRVRARLMPPAPPALPGGYDFARRAWFDGLGATGRIVPPLLVLDLQADRAPSLQSRLSNHVAAQVPGGAGAIAATLASGDRGHISPEDEEAMRRSGLAHLLSISGLHVTALVGLVVFAVYRLLALSPWLALRWPLMLVAAGAGAAAGIGYTLLTGAEVPTVRSCIAAILVMAGLALGRDAISLRLLATGALLILLFWPEAVIGPSFQLSFAAVLTIVALYEHPVVRGWFERREEAIWRRLLRAAGALLLTGIAVECALAPIALYHFHLTGLLGALANLVAIPLTSFVIMPAEMVALLLDIAGLGAPAWWVVGRALDLLLWIAHAVAAQDKAILLMPAVPAGAFAAAVLGALWLLLWRTRLRRAGIPVALAGLAGFALAPMPDILVTADGRHVALRTADGGVALLRDRAGDYVRDQFAELTAYEGEMQALADLPASRCSPDFCALTVEREGRATALLVARSRLMVPWGDLVRSCRSADIVIADRRLPRACQPRWLKLDRADLARHGGAAIMLADRKVRRSRNPRDQHPWIARPRPPRPPKPAPSPAGRPAGQL